MSEQQDAANGKTEEEDVITVEVAEKILIKGDLSGLSVIARLRYYRLMCDKLGISYLTRPFEFVTLNGKLVLYARKDATDQLRKNHGVSITSIKREYFEDIYTVIVTAEDKYGKVDEAMGAVFIGGLKGQERANALMKTETKAKRRVTLSIVGLGMLSEEEVEDIRGAVKIDTPRLLNQGKKEETPTEVPALAAPETDENHQEKE